eukprot:365984-Chlamydomonas_euryale.AAC.11
MCAQPPSPPPSKCIKAGRTGPKISSRHTRIEGVTLVKTVGWTKKPAGRCSGRPPPVSSVAPSCLPASMRGSGKCVGGVAAGIVGRRGSGKCVGGVAAGIVGRRGRRVGKRSAADCRGMLGSRVRGSTR